MRLVEPVKHLTGRTGCRELACVLLHECCCELLHVTVFHVNPFGLLHETDGHAMCSNTHATQSCRGQACLSVPQVNPLGLQGTNGHAAQCPDARPSIGYASDTSFSLKSAMCPWECKTLAPLTAMYSCEVQGMPTCEPAAMAV